MRTARFASLIVCTSLVVTLASCAHDTRPDTRTDTGRWQPDAAPLSNETARLYHDAYVFGYPLVLMDVSREVMTAVPAPTVTRAPINQLMNLAAFPDASFTDVVSPNADTLYSSAWLDLSDGPIVLTVPDTQGRYYVMQMLSGWTDVFASPGARTTGTGAGDFAIVGPDWRGALPPGVKELRSPTSIVWMIGRTQTNGKADYDTVHALQAQYRITPINRWGGTYTPPARIDVARGIDTRTAPVEQVAKMSPEQFFARLNALMVKNPPQRHDAAAMRRFEPIGVAPGRKFVNSDGQALNEGVKAAQEDIRYEATHQGGRATNGWVINTGLGDYGDNYRQRAVVAYFALGANLDADAIYPSARVDSEARPLDGAHRYTITFPKGQTPPAKAFWSVTMYNDKQAFVDNPIDRYAIGDRDALKANPDGSTTIYLQRENPGAERESNWLPAPAGPFNLLLRVYWPKPEMTGGRWAPPPIVRAD